MFCLYHSTTVMISAASDTKRRGEGCARECVFTDVRVCVSAHVLVFTGACLRMCALAFLVFIRSVQNNRDRHTKHLL